MSIMGLKRNSELLQIGASVTMTGVDISTEVKVSLPLSSLDREVFVITDVIMDVDFPAIIEGTNSRTFAQLTKTQKGNVNGTLVEFVAINDPDLVARVDERIIFPGSGELAFVRTSSYDNHQNTTGTLLDNLGILATPDFFLSCDTVGAGSAKSAFVRVYGYRAKADADTYAAMVTSELYQ